MKTTFIHINKKNKRRLKLHSLKDTIQSIGSEDYKDEIGWLRDFCRYAHKYAEFKYMHRLPIVCPSAEMKTDKAGNLVMQTFNGLIVLNISMIETQEEADSVKRMVAMLPMTVMAVWGSSGRTVKVVVRVSRPDGTLPQTEDEAVRLCRQAYPLASQLYEVAARKAKTTNTLTVGPALRHDLNGELQAGFRITCDETAYYNANAAALSVPDELPVDDTCPLIPAADDAATESTTTMVGKETSLRRESHCPLPSPDRFPPWA